MINAIDLKELINPPKFNFKTDIVLKNHNNNTRLKISNLLNLEQVDKEGHKKQIVPIKQYSNKFLREEASKENDKDKNRDKNNIKHSRVTSIVSKHKAFQKKYHQVLNKKQYICRTEPNQNQYKCFTTSHNFYQPQPDPEIIRVKTDCMIQKDHFQSDVIKIEKEEQRSDIFAHLIEAEAGKIKSKNQLMSAKKQEKISTSRALQLFSRIITKDKGELLDRMRSCHQKKLLKDRIMASTKNLQARQIMLFEKQKKFSFVEKGERKISLKTGLKYQRRKPSQILQLFDDEQNYEIKGWDVST